MPISSRVKRVLWDQGRGTCFAWWTQLVPKLVVRGGSGWEIWGRRKVHFEGEGQG